MSAAPARGFTLLEVLVALAVIALGLVALLGAAGAMTRTAGDLASRTFAHWVAMNVLAEIRLTGQWPDTGTRDGRADLAGLEWRWTATVRTTDDPDIRRIEIEVATGDDDEPVTTLVGFIGRPQTRFELAPGAFGAPPPPPPGGGPDDDEPPPAK